MSRRYIAWAILKSIMGSLLMFDSILLAVQLAPDAGLTVALIKTGNASMCFIGFFLILSSLMGGFGIVTENYQLIEGKEAKSC